MKMNQFITSENNRFNSTEMAQEAGLRANVYDFLSRIFLEEIDLELLQALKNPETAEGFEAWGIDFLEDLKGNNFEELLEQLAEAYCSTFITGNPVGLFPYESVQRHGCYEGKSTIQVKNFYSKCFFQLPEECPEFVDHLGLEMDFMTKLAQKEADLWQKDERDEIEQNRKYQQDFLEQHLLVWTPGFAQKITQFATHPFYQSLGKLAKEFLAMEKERFDLI